jgi:hypothetical protein
MTTARLAQVMVCSMMALATSACTIGYGTHLPGYRGEDHGISVSGGMRAGVTEVDLGEDYGSGLGFEAVAEVTMAPVPFASLGLSYAWAMDVLAVDGGELGHTSYPISLTASVFPLEPFVLQGGIAAADNSIVWKAEGSEFEELIGQGWSFQYFYGAGLTLNFPSMIAVIGAQMRHRPMGDLTIKGVTRPYRSDSVMWQVLFVFENF